MAMLSQVIDIILLKQRNIDGIIVYESYILM